MWSDFVLGGFGFIGVAFFLCASVGLIRFPDLPSRLHALTKADNVGLGFIALGVALHRAELLAGLKVLLIWLILLASSGIMAYLIAQRFGTGQRTGS